MNSRETFKTRNLLRIRFLLNQELGMSISCKLSGWIIFFVHKTDILRETFFSNTNGISAAGIMRNIFGTTRNLIDQYATSNQDNS
ncbi:hypothetical protein COW36_23815 [bacterium (Candidatus Blackallbacteria) CG17_big_fil_post_rev_8_21_14_2_50_48_46]|uniref:Uncharacterized protein n=1 Tax=bacterium (Candidatus Blackallbacteria) CG17_big_fil_post_rev_8_21_14_2_50_48_46 TaxID=2014261 RepID=A0A2M7FWT2_9BACT|nr:MAG: hypothetical protein COW36_23815 [bacterium (Candidatus Blackallbacteria) CG17_big_fil_post_rev_8_21_14_2_50_48_46]PIW44927.1 MAG: hypothetical protein COW20_21445 [bacterium (Candidatus Blackallbacteria) CG13_big_fil_rev_8_21_14_2_50_49_14]